MTESEIRQKIVDPGRRLRDRLFVALNDGNISARLSDNEVLITPTSVNKGDSPRGGHPQNRHGQQGPRGERKPSSQNENAHRGVPRGPDVQAVVRTRTRPHATGFAACRIRLDRDVILPEVVFGLGKIGFAEYGTPTTDEIPNAVVKEIPDCEALLLSNHGALTVGPDVMQAYYRMEVLGDVFARAPRDQDPRRAQATHCE